MKFTKLDDMIGGWFIGPFLPTAFSTNACEVAVKRYKQGAYEQRHFHLVATEITLILSGRVRMANHDWVEGDVIMLEPGDATDFYAITDAINVVVKVPGVIGDKYLDVPN